VFLTQQASSGAGQFHQLLGLDPPPDREFHVALAIEQLERSGLRVEQSGVGLATTVFIDVGALAWYLPDVPWAVPRFSITRHREALLALHGQAIAVPPERFWIRAVVRDTHLRNMTVTRASSWRPRRPECAHPAG
jgi:hypothetical protein